MNTVAQTKYPPQIKFIIGNEGAERFSYYGMVAILVIFMTERLGFAKSDASATYHYFSSLAFFTPLLGGYISDRFLGKYRTIISLSLIYCLGHLILALWENKMGLYLGLFCVALGAGGIKPCVSAHVGDQFTTANKHLIAKIFYAFYWIINFGSFFSTLLTPWILQNYGSGWAFGVPGILMVLATFIFWLGRKYYIFVPPTGKDPHGFFSVLMSGFKNRKSAGSFWKGSMQEHPQETVEGIKATLSVGKIFIATLFFWSLFMQHGSTWVLQAKQMQTFSIFGHEILPAQMSAMNPVLVMLLIPVFTYGIYPLLEKLGIRLTAIKKIGTGMLISSSAFIASALIQRSLDQGLTISMLWQIIPYILITIGEIFISITALEFSYTQTPRSMKSRVMGLWFLSVSLGNLLSGIVAKFILFEGAIFFFFFAILMFLAFFLYLFLIKGYQERSYVEKEGAFGTH